MRLEKWQDQPLWFDQLKTWCQKNVIWNDIDPKYDEEQLVYLRPRVPTHPIKLNAEPRANFQKVNLI